MKEFDLSVEIEHDGWLDITYVKEFIRLLKKEMENAQENCGNLDWISKDQALEIIDKLAGEDLK